MADIPEMIYYSQKRNLATWMILSKEEYPDAPTSMCRMPMQAILPD
jgi:hypothetical protein